MDKPITFSFWLATLLSPIVMILVTIGVLMGVDFITYVKSQSKDEEISRKEQLKHLAIKFLIYLIAIASTYFFEKMISSDIPLLKITIGFIMIAEIKSIAENYQKIYGSDLLKSLIDFFKKLWKKESVQ